MDVEIKPRTINDLAAHLGVSPMTVHRAISGKPDVAARTRSRNLDEIERIGWQPNIAARGLRQGKTYTLGVLVSNVAASFLPEILHGVNRTAEAEGSHAIVCVHEHETARAERHLFTLQSKGVDGIVYYPTETGGEAAVLAEVRRSTPVVLVMRTLPDFDGPAVLIDDRLGGRLAAEHLLGLGHRRIGFLGYADTGFTRRREAGLREALAGRGLELRPDWTVADLRFGDEAARERAVEILRQRERPTAFFCASDRLAARAAQAAAALGIRIPEDLSLVGYNNDPWVQLLPAPLTTIAQPRMEVGERAARLALDAALDGRLNGSHPNGNTNTAKAARIVLEPRLVVRASTAPPA